MTIPTHDDCVWTAGFYDGEGGISLKGPSHLLNVGISQRQEEIMRYIHTLFGGRFQTGQSPEKRPVWFVFWGPNTAKCFLQAILPYVKIKRWEVQFALDWIAKDRTFPRLNGLGKMSSSHIAWRSEMNRRLDCYREGSIIGLYVATNLESKRLIPD